MPNPKSFPFLLMKFHKNSAYNRLCLTANHLSARSFYSSIEQGSKFSPSFKKYLAQDGRIKSYMHDIPLEFDPVEKTANMVVEIPRWSHAKFEIDTKAEGNPIKQDTKKGKVRFIKNVFPHHGYVHNYGAFPQTWEDVTNTNGDMNLHGDNDPLDVVEIGSTAVQTGDIVKVKILGSLALIDDGELDWKIIAINVQDKLAAQLNSIDDVSKVCPGLLESTREWFRNYKLPEGKPLNKFALDEQYQSVENTLHTVQENHSAWNELIHGRIGGDKSILPNITNTTVRTSPGFKLHFDDAALLTTPPQPNTDLPHEVHELYYKPI